MMTLPGSLGLTLPFTGVDQGAIGPMGNVDPSPELFLPDVQSGSVESPSTSSDLSPYSQYSNENYFDDYLTMLQKGAQVGLFSTAQDVVNEAQKDRMFQSLEAQKEREWYEGLSNTAYQRQVADLEAAGLNPILGWSNFGSGAVTAHTQVPQGTATGLRATAPNLADYLNAGANLISSAADIFKFFKPILSMVSKG